MPETTLLIAALDAVLDERGLGFVSVIISIALTLLIALFTVFLVKQIVRRALLHKTASADPMRQKRMSTAASVIVSLTKYLAFFIAAAVSIGELGLSGPMKSLLAAAGIGTVIIGIGAQSLVSDMVSGFFLLFEDQFAVGDYISTGGVTGTVEAFTLRTTTVRAYTGERHTVSNGSIKTLTNYSRTDTLAVVDVPIASGADSERAMALMAEVAGTYCAELGETAREKPLILGAARAEGGALVLRATVLVKPLEHWGVERELTRRILARFKAEGIELPYTRVAIGGEDGAE